MESSAAKPRRSMTMVASHFNGWGRNGGVEKACRRYATAHRGVVAYLKARLLPPVAHQPLKRLATIVKCLRHWIFGTPVS